MRSRESHVGPHSSGLIAVSCEPVSHSSPAVRSRDHMTSHEHEGARRVSHAFTADNHHLHSGDEIVKNFYMCKLCTILYKHFTIIVQIFIVKDCNNARRF